MLVLSRKLGEQICIGTEIQVTVLAIHKGKIRLGLAAPRELPIYREEVRRRIDFESALGHVARSDSDTKVT